MITVPLLMSSFLFFRYIRANKAIVLFLMSLFFTALAIYESRHSVLLLITLFFWAGLQVIIAYLKERGDARIKRLQRGYKTTEIIIHYISFGVIAFLILFIQWLLIGGIK